MKRKRRQSGRITRALRAGWRVVLDPGNVGKRQGWHRNPPCGLPAKVPGVWETVKPGYDGVGWYHTSFRVPAGWLARRIILRFDAVNYHAECWLNGRRLGAHEGGYTGFSFNITALARAGANALVVRVINPPTDREIEGFRSGAPLNQGNIPVGKAAWYYNFGGIWQDVHVEVTDPVAVTDCYVQPFPAAQEALLHITIENQGAAASHLLLCRIEPGAQVQRQDVALAAGLNTFCVRVPISSPRCWSPDDPFLYTATVSIAGRDTHAVRFGMREFTAADGRFLLNGRPILLKGFLHQGAYPRTLAFPENEAMARRELRLLRDAGFNFLRLHLKPAPPRYLDLADEMGLLVMAEPPIGWIMNSPETEARCLREVEQLILRDRNHPSIVMWCLLNEAYAFLGFSVEQVLAMTTRIAARARALDPSRLLIDTSGGQNLDPTGGTADMMVDSSQTQAGNASFLLPHAFAMERFVDAHAYCALPVSDTSLANYRGAGLHGMVFVVSEYGAAETPPPYDQVLAAYRPAERRAGLEDYRLHKDFRDSLRALFAQARLQPVFGSLPSFLAQVNRVRADEMRLATTALRSNPNLGGLCYCQLADAGGELFGALDQWRRPKPLWHALAAAVRTPLLAPFLERRALACGETLPVHAALISETASGRPHRYTLRLRAPSGRAVCQQRGTLRAQGAVQAVSPMALPVNLRPGRYQVEACLDCAGEAPRREALEFMVLDRGAPSLSAAAVHSADPALGRHLEARGLRVELFGNNYRGKGVPVLLDLRDGFAGNRCLLMEYISQLKKIVQLGGCAILFEPEPLLLQDVLFSARLRMQPLMRSCDYVRPHPIFSGIAEGGAADYLFADVAPKKYERGADVAAAGGEVLYGALGMNMWTRPACYYWGAALYTVPVGRGTVIVCQLGVLGGLDRTPVADRLLVNLLNHASTQIRPGGERHLLTRCIDPVPSAAT